MVKTPSPSAWMPRTPCGLACSSLASRSSSTPTGSGAGLRRAFAMGCLLQDPLDGGQRDPYPLGSMGRLVRDFVHRLVELEHGEHRRPVAMADRENGVDPLDVVVPLQEPGA